MPFVIQQLGPHLTATAIGLHEVTPTPAKNAKGQVDGGYVTPNQLAGYIRRKRAAGFQFVSLDGAFGGSPGTTKTILMTFDDGYLGNFQYAAPVLRQEKVPAVFFIHPDTIGSTEGAYAKMSWAQAAQLAGDPLFEIGSHSAFHQDLRTVDLAALRQNFHHTNAAILRHTGQLPRAIAYPGGYHDTDVGTAAAAHYQCGFSYGREPSSLAWRFALPRIAIYQSNIGTAGPDAISPKTK